MIEFIGKVKASAARFVADRSSQYCLQASLLEAAAVVGAEVKSLNNVIPEATVPPADALYALQEGSSFLGMELVRVLINPSLVENANVGVPDVIADRVEEVTGVQQVNFPHIRLLFYDLGGDEGYVSHAECDDNSRRSRKRIGELENSGWFTGAIAEVRKSLDSE